MSLTVSKEQQLFAYDESTNTSFLGKTENDTFVFTGKASDVSFCLMFERKDVLKPYI